MGRKAPRTGWRARAAVEPPTSARSIAAEQTLRAADIASQVGLSTTPCWCRIQRLEERGVIGRCVALLDRNQLNLGVDVFVAVKTAERDATWLATFAQAVTAFDEVVERYRISGEIDHLMRVVVRDIAVYDDFYQRLIRKVRLSDVSSSFAMERLKYTTALPLGVG